MTLELIHKIQKTFFSDKKRIISLILFSLVLIIISTIFVHQNNIKKTIDQGRTIISTQVRPHLKSIGFVEKDSLIINHDYQFIFTKRKDKNAIDIISEISGVLNSRSLAIDKLNIFPGNNGFSISVLHKDINVAQIAFLLLETPQISCAINSEQKDEQVKPRLAIVIDDFGYSRGKTAREFIGLDAKLTISIIPGHQFTQWAIEEGLKQDKEIIIHMPMEPETNEFVDEEKEYLLTSNSSSEENRHKLLKAIKDIPQAIGLNNHMGSKATTDKKLMTIVAEVIKVTDLYFLDSVTSPGSVAFDICNEFGIPSLKRSVFIDHERDEKYIENQLNKAIIKAKKTMSAIALGHVNKHTIKVIKKMLDNGSFSEITLCFASELL